MQYSAIHCNTLQYTAIHCSTLQHTAIHCNTLQHTDIIDDIRVSLSIVYCSALQCVAVWCSVLQRGAVQRSASAWASAVTRHCSQALCMTIYIFMTHLTRIKKACRIQERILSNIQINYVTYFHTRAHIADGCVAWYLHMFYTRTHQYTPSVQCNCKEISGSCRDVRLREYGCAENHGFFLLHCAVYSRPASCVAQVSLYMSHDSVLNVKWLFNIGDVHKYVYICDTTHSWMWNDLFI